MNNERILSYRMSKRLSADEVEKISGAGTCSQFTANGTYSGGAWDGCMDLVVDL